MASYKSTCRRPSPASKPRSAPSRRCGTASWSSRPLPLAHQRGLRHRRWCSCWQQLLTGALNTLPLDSPTRGRVYTLCVGMAGRLGRMRDVERFLGKVSMTESLAFGRVRIETVQPVPDAQALYEEEGKNHHDITRAAKSYQSP